MNQGNRQFILSDAFLSFYTEVARIKSEINSDDPMSSLPRKVREVVAQKVGGNAINYKVLAEYLSKRLENYLKRERERATERLSRVELEMYQQAEYVMVALADELFILEIEWDGKEYWSNFLLEKRLFNTDWSGEEFFRRLKLLLDDKSQDTLVIDLAQVYLLAIRIGFAGKYRGRDRYRALGELQAKLLSFIGQVEEETLFFEESYDIQNEAVGARLAPAWPWIKGSVIVFLGYLVISFYVWDSSVDELLEAFAQSGVEQSS